MSQLRPKKAQAAAARARDVRIVGAAPRGRRGRDGARTSAINQSALFGMNLRQNNQRKITGSSPAADRSSETLDAQIRVNLNGVDCAA